MDALQKLLSEYNWNLHCWDDRYGRGLWAIVGPNENQTQEIKNIIDGGDTESYLLTDYLHEEGNWLPVVKEKKLVDALTILNTKIEPFVDNDIWKIGVSDAFATVIDKNDGGYGLKIAIDQKTDKLFTPF